jgi:hypothetical protein
VDEQLVVLLLTLTAGRVAGHGAGSGGDSAPHAHGDCVYTAAVHAERHRAPVHDLIGWFLADLVLRRHWLLQCDLRQLIRQRCGHAVSAEPSVHTLR